MLEKENQPQSGIQNFQRGGQNINQLKEKRGNNNMNMNKEKSDGFWEDESLIAHVKQNEGGQAKNRIPRKIEFEKEMKKIENPRQEREKMGGNKDEIMERIKRIQLERGDFPMQYKQELIAREKNTLKVFQMEVKKLHNFQFFFFALKKSHFLLTVFSPKTHFLIEKGRRRCPNVQCQIIRRNFRKELQQPDSSKRGIGEPIPCRSSRRKRKILLKRSRKHNRHICMHEKKSHENRRSLRDRLSRV